ncbi:MAG: GNAT family protein [Phototrophicaceae bacterium]
MFFQYAIDAHITLELQSPFHAQPLFDLVYPNRKFIGEHLNWAKRIHDVDDMQHYLRRDLLGMADERRWAWLIRYDGEVAGRIGLSITVPALQECELFYFLGEQFTGRGIITKATKIVTDFAVNVLGIEHILIAFTTENEKSGAVPKRLGFSYEYTMRDAELHDGEWRTLHFWGILAKDWQSTIKPTFDYQLAPHLTLRLYQPYQAAEKFAVLRDNQTEFSQWFWWANDTFTLAKERDIVRRILKRYMKQSAMSVTIWQNQKLIGHASLSIDMSNNGGNVGYWLDYRARGQGIMTQTVRALFDSAFTIYSVERMRILAAKDNIGSRAIAERLGMQLELVQRDETIIGGQFIDHVQYSLLRDEWKEKQA